MDRILHRLNLRFSSVLCKLISGTIATHLRNHTVHDNREASESWVLTSLVVVWWSTFDGLWDALAQSDIPDEPPCSVYPFLASRGSGCTQQKFESRRFVELKYTGTWFIAGEILPVAAITIRLLLVFTPWLPDWRRPYCMTTSPQVFYSSTNC